MRNNRVIKSVAIAALAVATAADAAKATPATRPATRSSASGEAVAWRDLPPGMAAALRPQFSRQLVDAIERRRIVLGELDANRTRYGEQSAEVLASREEAARLEGVIDGLNAALAEPLPAAAPPAATDPLPRVLGSALRWPAEHARALTVLLLLFVAGSAVTLVLTPRNAGRAWVNGLFGLLLAGGGAAVFAVGVAIGSGRPIAECVLLLASALVPVVGSAFILRHNRRPPAEPAICPASAGSA